MPEDRRLVHRSLSDRELLLLVADRVEIAIPALVKTQEDQGKDIKSLLKFRWMAGGAIAALAALFGLRGH